MAGFFFKKQINYGIHNGFNYNDDIIQLFLKTETSNTTWNRNGTRAKFIKTGLLYDSLPF